MKKYIFSENGSISLYALIAMIILISVLFGVYTYYSQKQIQNLDVTQEIKSVYERDVANVNEIYNNMVNVSLTPIPTVVPTPIP